MKKILNLNLLIALFVVAFTATSCSDDDDDRRVSPETLPQVGQAFISLHFPDAMISYLEKNH